MAAAMSLNSGKFRRFLRMAVASLLIGAAPSAEGVTFGAVGDSLTDEYQFEGGLVALNFLEQLVLLRGLDFGPRVTDSTLRGEPRNEGFSHNWARFGASANEPTYAGLNLFNELPRLNPMPLFSEQVDGLAAEIAGGAVDVVYVGIGANDYFIHLFLDGKFNGPEFVQFSNALVGTVFSAVDTFLAAGSISLVVGALPDELVPNPGAHPPISPFIDPADFAAAVAQTNQALAQGAGDRGVAFVNLFDGVDARTDPQGNITVGGISFADTSVAKLSQLLFNPAPGEDHGPCNLEGTFCASEAYAFNYFTHDMVHPNTIIQGLMANEFIRVLNDEFGLEIATLSDAEILDVALHPVPEPVTAPLGGAALALAWLARRRRPGRPGGNRGGAG
jgi:hypothetical protein